MEGLCLPTHISVIGVIKTILLDPQFCYQKSFSMNFNFFFSNFEPVRVIVISMTIPLLLTLKGYTV